MQTAIVEIKSASQSALEVVNGFNLDRLAEYVVKTHPEYADSIEQLIVQYRLFICLCATSKKPISVPSLDVDNVWHCHLQLNADYNAFTTLVAGKIIIHNPHDENVSEELKSICKQNLIDASFDVFGYFAFDPSLVSCNLQPCTDIKAGSCNLQPCTDVKASCTCTPAV